MADDTARVENESGIEKGSDGFPKLDLTPKGKNMNIEIYGESKGWVAPITLNLNGSPITLPEKNDGEPHTFLELMKYANIDTKNPGGHGVELSLNGLEISFGEELHEGDTAVVRWKD